LRDRILVVVACVFPEFDVLFVSFASVLKKWVIGFVLFSYQFGPLFIVIVVVCLFFFCFFLCV
jgi:hypothetical protein